jgi:hypothetical protein
MEGLLVLVDMRGLVVELTLTYRQARRCYQVILAVLMLQSYVSKAREESSRRCLDGLG